MVLFSETENGFVAFLSTLEGNLTKGIRLKSGKRFDSLNDFMAECTSVSNGDEITHWIYHTDDMKKITIYND